MIKVSILYPNKPGSRFDMNYYLANHMPMAIQRLGKGCAKRKSMPEFKGQPR